MANVVWNDDGWGILVNEQGETICSVANFKTGIAYTIHNYMMYISTTPKYTYNLSHGLPLPSPSMASSYGIMFNLKWIYPKVDADWYLCKCIQQAVNTYISKIILQPCSPNVIPIHFILKSASRLIPEKHCPICIEEYSKVHRPINIMRPCGHYVCGQCISSITICPICRETIVDLYDLQNTYLQQDIIEQITTPVYENACRYYNRT